MTDSENPKGTADADVVLPAGSAGPLVFISHDGRDAELAEAFGKLLKSVGARMIKTFRSSDKKGTDGIDFGDEWYNRLACTFLIFGVLLSPPVVAQSLTTGKESQPLAISNASAGKKEWALIGDLRTRFESDGDSRRPDGSLRDDRARFRVRARVGVEWSPDERWSFRVRARTGSHMSQQSPHLTLHDFSGGEADDFDGAFDQWFVQGKSDNIRVWGGRNDFPFFYASESQEMIWDRDATLTGGFLSWKLPGAPANLTLNAGGFALPEGMDRWNGALWAGQAVIQHDITGSLKVKGGLTFLGVEGGGASDRLLDGNDSRDYRIGVASLQLTWTFPGDVGYLRLGVDGLHNFSDYSSSDSDPVTARHHGGTDGVVAAVAVGPGKPDQPKAAAWEIDYTFGYVEKLAINASYAQDDWVRWGSGSQTDSSDFRGHEIGLRYWLMKDLDVHARFYSVEAISTRQDGLRFRIDLNYRF